MESVVTACQHTVFMTAHYLFKVNKGFIIFKPTVSQSLQTEAGNRAVDPDTRANSQSAWERKVEMWRHRENRSTGALREELKLSLRSTRSHDVLQCKYEKYQSHEHEWIKQLPFLSWLPVCLSLALTLRQCLLQPHGIHMHEDTYA